MQAAEAIAPMQDTVGKTLALVDDDPLFRESITQNLRDHGYSVSEFGDGPTFLETLNAGSKFDLLLLDWKMPRMNGIEVLAHVRDVTPNLPVIFLTVLNDQIYEEAALLGGAVDFVEKSRSFSIMLRRIELSPRLQQEVKENGSVATTDDGVFGKLRLSANSRRAYWNNRQVDLTLSEFSIVNILIENRGHDVPYRRIYDVVHGNGFVAGHGTDGYRTNVRSSIKRIRQKFRELDPDFDCIENYPGFGYRWRIEG